MTAGIVNVEVYRILCTERAHAALEVFALCQSA